MDPEEQHNICRLIEAVIVADGVVAEEEREFLRRVVRRFGVAYDVNEVGPVDDDVPLSRPGRASEMLHELSPQVQARVLALRIDAAVTDGEVHPKERAILLVAAAALGIDASAVEERIQHRQLARAGARSEPPSTI